MTVTKIDLDKIKPTFNDKNWKLESQNKVEIINGEVFTTLNKNHWIYPMIKKNKSFTSLGFYVDKDKPKELVRVSGMAPDLWVLVFKVI